MEDYKWSSYNEYIGKPDICNIDFGLDMISDNRKKAIEIFKEYNYKENEDKCLDLKDKRRLNDSKAKEIILKITKTENSNEVMDFDRERKKKAIRSFRQSGLYIRQISRLTGISTGIIRGISID